MPDSRPIPADPALDAETGAELQDPSVVPFIRGVWYVALPAAELKPGRMVAQTLLGEPVLFGRKRDGEVFAIRDQCPHRGIPLRFGDFDGDTVGCTYHGWRFGGDGVCTKIPSLVEQSDVNLQRIKCGAYPVQEAQGLIWIFFGDPLVDQENAPPALDPFPRFETMATKAAMRLVYNSSFDDAAFGMMDPAHIPFVHRAWWLKRNAKTLQLKEKHFEPFGFGWRMKPHTIPNLTPFHRMLGGQVTTEIQLRLPGYRIELIYGEKHQILNVLAITPIDQYRTQMLQALWWTMPGLDFLGPLVAFGAKRFLRQDGDIIDKQNEGFKHGRRQMLVPDADNQMKWWLKTKREWTAHRMERRPFENPVTEATHRFRS